MIYLWILLLFLQDSCYSQSVDCWFEAAKERNIVINDIYKDWEGLINERRKVCEQEELLCAHNNLLYDLPQLLECLYGPIIPDLNNTVVVDDNINQISYVKVYKGLPSWCWKFDYDRDKDVDLEDIYFFYRKEH
jgi:hypothetical protein